MLFGNHMASQTLYSVKKQDHEQKTPFGPVVSKSHHAYLYTALLHTVLVLAMNEYMGVCVCLLHVFVSMPVRVGAYARRFLWLQSGMPLPAMS